MGVYDVWRSRHTHKSAGAAAAPSFLLLGSLAYGTRRCHSLPARLKVASVLGGGHSLPPARGHTSRSQGRAKRRAHQLGVC